MIQHLAQTHVAAAGPLTSAKSLHDAKCYGPDVLWHSGCAWHAYVPIEMRLCVGGVDLHQLCLAGNQLLQMLRLLSSEFHDNVNNALLCLTITVTSCLSYVRQDGQWQQPRQAKERLGKKFSCLQST